MPMMNIRKMCVAVFDRFVNVGVGVRFVTVPVGVCVLMMRIVEMRMFVFQRRMTMSMGVVLGEMQPHARAHEETGNDQRRGEWCTDGHGQDSADEGRQGEVGAG